VVTLQTFLLKYCFLYILYGIPINIDIFISPQGQSQTQLKL